MGRGTTVIGLIALQLQSTALLGSIDLPWPSAWTKVMHYIQLANLDPTQLIDNSALPPVSFHTLYLLFANLLPMLIALGGLLVFQPARFVVWYAVLSASLVWLGVGLAMHYGLTDTKDDSAALWYIVGGGALTFLCAVVGGAAYAVRHVNDDNEEAAEEEVRRKHRAKRAMDLAFSGSRSAKHLLIAGSTFVGGCALTGLFVAIPGTSRQTGILHAVGILLLAVCTLHLLYFFGSLFATGRSAIVKIETFLRANALLGLLLLVSITYVPTIDYCVASFMCAPYECPAGTVFNPRADRDENSFTRSPSLYCDPCEFRDARCNAADGWLYAAPTPAPPAALPTTAAPLQNGTSAANFTTTVAPTTMPATTAPRTTYNETVAAYCPAFRSRRVWKFPEVPCDDPSLTYFFVSSSVVLFCYVFLVPVLYVRLITMLTDVLHRRVVLIPKDETDNVEYLPPPQVYARQVYTVEPAAASLYQPFTLHYRYFAIVLLAFRLVLVVFAGVLGPWYPQWGLYCLAATHVAGAACLLGTRPFIERVEHLFAVALEGCSVVNTGFAIAIYHGFDAPPWLVYVLFITNVVVPVVAAAATFRFVRTRARKNAREAHEKHLASQAENDDARPEEMTRLAPQDSIEAALLTGKPLLRKPSAGSPGSPKAGSKFLTFSSEVRKKGLKHIQIPKAILPTPHEEEQIVEENEQLKAGLNMKTADMVTTFFAALGVLLLFAGGCGVLGYLRGSHTDFPDGSTRSERGPMPVIAGYDSFDAMTANCCCIRSEHPAAAFNVTERWLCPGHSVVVDRGRMGFDGFDNGLPIRPLCGDRSTVALGCSITVNGTASGGTEVLLSCPTAVTPQQWSALGVSEYARSVLF